MDHEEYTTLVAALRAVPDPRKACGQRYPWELLLTVIAAALASAQPHGRAISQWVHEHADELTDVLAVTAGRMPSEATLRRALQAVDVVALDACVQALWPVTERPGAEHAAAELVGIAIDGTAVRGVRAPGRIVHLVSLVRHDGRVLAQTAVADKTNEITAAPGLLAEQPLHDTVVTMDALLTQRALARQIQRQGGHYLMAVKDNQPTLLDAISTLFTVPPWLPAERAQEVWETQTLEKGHGRLETRTLMASTALNAYVRWPGVDQVLQRTCRRVQVATGEVTEETTYAITSLTPAQASPAVLERLWRGHWTIENRVHHVRDVAFGEDATRAWVGNTAHALASLRNALLNLLRAAGWTRIPDALRYHAARVERALTLIGVQPS